VCDPLVDAWLERDLPVLRAIVAYSEEHNCGPRVDQLVEASGLATDRVRRAAQNLARDGLIKIRGAMGRPVLYVTDLSSDALRHTGPWPTPETADDRMLSRALENIAKNSDDEDKRTQARRVLDVLTAAGRSIGISVVTEATSGQRPGQSQHRREPTTALGPQPL
jgi:hypothetical protein